MFAKSFMARHSPFTNSYFPNNGAHLAWANWTTDDDLHIKPQTKSDFSSGMNFETWYNCPNGLSICGSNSILRLNNYRSFLTYLLEQRNSWKQKVMLNCAANIKTHIGNKSYLSYFQLCLASIIRNRESWSCWKLLSINPQLLSSPPTRVSFHWHRKTDWNESYSLEANKIRMYMPTFYGRYNSRNPQQHTKVTHFANKQSHKNVSGKQFSLPCHHCNPHSSGVFHAKRTNVPATYECLIHLPPNCRLRWRSVTFSRCKKYCLSWWKKHPLAI